MNLTNILISLFKRYSRSKFSKSKNMAIVDFRIFKGFGGHLYGFMIYTKIIGKNLGCCNNWKPHNQTIFSMVHYPGIMFNNSNEKI